jgi:hypothetical protein
MVGILVSGKLLFAIVALAALAGVNEAELVEDSILDGC